MKLEVGCVAILLAGAVHGLEPCAEVTDSFDSSKKSNSTFLISGDLAHRCLQSIPFKVPQAVAFLDEYRKYLPFQSTLDDLKNPPAGYIGSPVDIIGGLDKIQEKARQNKYSNQFDFDSDLLDLVSSANDGHFQIKPCSTNVFSFTHGEPLVSVSQDGLKLPEVYTLSDARLLAQGKPASPVKSINGTDTTQYLQKFSSNQGQQDPDARTTKVPKGLWMETNWWPGPSFLLEFKNGTKRNFETLAKTDYEVMEARNGTAMYDRACTGQGEFSSQQSGMSNTQAADKPGYPKTTIRANDALIYGYTSNKDALRDTAVLALPTFSILSSNMAPFMGGFLRNVTQQGKKKLLIDLSGNPGGNIVAAFSLFAELFPGKEMYLGSRLRSHEGANSLARVFSHMNQSEASEEGVVGANPFIYQVQVTPDQKRDFATWKDLYNPHEVLQSNLSSLFASFNLTETSDNGDNPINGYGPVPLNPRKAAFAPENITIITDGFCASTCTTFVTLMKEQGVRSIAFGGRPRTEPMQAMGGVKGAQSVDLPDIWRFFKSAQNIIARSMGTKSPVFSRDEWKRFNETAVPNSNYFSLKVLSAGVNLRNAYGPDDDTTPLQFVYEAADCRRFFTVENYFDQESVWQATAEAMFGDGECVGKSTKGRDN